MNLVSILMPVKNAAPFLEECLVSIQHQTYENWELIAIDDHSSDQSIKILNDHASADPRIIVFKNPGIGIISALQAAFERSDGNFITRMDADDMMVPHQLEKMVKALSGLNERTLVTGLVKYFSDQPVSKGYLKYENWINDLNLSGKQWSQIYRECVIASPNWMVFRQGIETIGGFDSLLYPEDYHMVLKWHEKGFSIHTIPEVTLLWREHPARTSRNSEHYGQKAFFHLKINHFIEHQLDDRPLILWGNNEKTRLTASILNKAGVEFLPFGLNNYRQIEKIEKPKLLVGVYPNETDRLQIESYLLNLSLTEGKDWWYI